MPAPSRPTQSLLANSRGQGIVEYILLIVIVLAIALAVSARLFKPFNEWASNYIGDYIYCLLDQGELPALGGENAVSECDKQFASYTFGGGRPANAEGSGDSESSEKGSRSRLNNSGDSSGGSYAGGGGRSGRARRSAPLGSGFDGEGSGRGSKVTDVTNQVNVRRVTIRSGPGVRNLSSDPSVLRANGLAGVVAQEQERIKKRDEKVTRVARATASASSYIKGRVKITPYEPPRSRQKELDLGDIDWSWGGALRFGLIIVIIIALLLFVGSQMLQISKSMEKE